ncbi:hypothetical protein DA456_04990 [Pseudomonas syringae pv. atrofaciens]|uniref:Uncharacterized protein n=1 Tax=Pseudomonas syringae pv. atrofaciens TaxID=192087 RepID=A0AAD0I689_PSESX|nr:hypothetical protein [Pseudomonas syringae]AVX22793.1 hypothetical protein DA456_04990 [Pseudomonas syringae pv. atrofaciens]
MSNEIYRATVHVADIHENTSQELISITSDKLKLVLIEHLDLTENSRLWHTPASLVVAVALVLLTSSFKDSLGVPAATWQAFFMFLLVAFVLWLLYALSKLRKRYSIDQLIEKIKKKKIQEF